MKLNREITHAGSSAEITALCHTRLHEFDTVNFVTAIHRLARNQGGQSSSALGPIVQHLQEKAGELKVQQLANTAWSFARLLISNGPLCDAISPAALQSIPQFGAQEFANIAWSFAKRCVLTVPMMDSLAAEAINIIGDFLPQHLGNTAWALARLLNVNEPLLDAIAGESIKMLAHCE